MGAPGTPGARDRGVFGPCGDAFSSLRGRTDCERAVLHAIRDAGHDRVHGNPIGIHTPHWKLLPPVSAPAALAPRMGLPGSMDPVSDVQAKKPKAAGSL